MKKLIAVLAIVAVFGLAGVAVTPAYATAIAPINVVSTGWNVDMVREVGADVDPWGCDWTGTGGWPYYGRIFYEAGVTDLPAAAGIPSDGLVTGTINDGTRDNTDHTY